MKKTILLSLLAVACLLLGGCAASQPLAKAQATDVPGLSMQLHAATAGETNVDLLDVTLYFRYLDEPMLASETRSLTVRRDESTESAILRALMDGPDSGHSELRRLLPEKTSLVGVTSSDNTLFVTLSADFLADDVPSDWQSSDAWREEAPMYRRLVVQSIVASITESFPYTGVQLLIEQPSGVARLDASYFLNGESGASEPIARDSALLLSPYNVVLCMLKAWQEQDFLTLYNYLAAPPAQDAFLLTAADGAALTEASVSGSTVSEDGRTSVVTLSANVLTSEGERSIRCYPLKLVRENGVWKISTDAALRLLKGEVS